MSKSLSVCDAPEAGPEPARPLVGHVELLQGQLDGVRRAISQHEMVTLYDHTEIPGVTKGDLGTGGPPGPKSGRVAAKGGRTTPRGGLHDPRRATVYDLAFGSVPEEQRPDRGEKLAATLAGLRHQEQVLAEAVAEHSAIADAHAEWAMAAGSEAIATVTDPQSLQVVVAAQEATIRDLECRLEAIEAHLSAGATPEVEAA